MNPNGLLGVIVKRFIIKNKSHICFTKMNTGKIKKRGITNEVVDVVFSHLVYSHFQQHDDWGDACQRHVINLLLVRLNDQFAERAAAVSVNLEAEEKKINNKNKKKKSN